MLFKMRKKVAEHFQEVKGSLLLVHNGNGEVTFPIKHLKKSEVSSDKDFQ